MSEKRNFRPRVIEPLLSSGAPGFGVELEFYERVSGLNGDTIVIYLDEKATIEDAEAIRNLLAQYGTKLKITNTR